LITKPITKYITLMVRVVVINGAVVPPVDDGDMMKTYNGFAALLKDVNQLPVTGWIFIDRGIDVGSEASIAEANYHLAETELEQIDFEKTKKTFVECPTLLDIVSILDKRPTRQHLSDYIGGVIYYRENDDFLD